MTSKRLPMIPAQDARPGDQILGEIVMAAVLFVNDEDAEEVVCDVEGFEAFLRKQGYAITKTDGSVTFTILDA